jgi:hypothetical protein
MVMVLYPGRVSITSCVAAGTEIELSRLYPVVRFLSVI